MRNIATIFALQAEQSFQRDLGSGDIRVLCQELLVEGTGDSEAPMDLE